MKRGGRGDEKGADGSLSSTLWQHEQKGRELKKDQNSYKDTKRNFIIIIIIIIVIVVGIVIIIIMRRLFFQ